MASEHRKRLLSGESVPFQTRWNKRKSPYNNFKIGFRDPIEKEVSIAIGEMYSSNKFSKKFHKKLT